MAVLNWYEIPCPVCGAEETNSWDKRISRALGYIGVGWENQYDTDLVGQISFFEAQPETVHVE